MEKLQVNYFKFNFLLISLLSLMVIFLDQMRYINHRLLPYLLLIGPYLAILFYFASKKSRIGYYFSNEGILVKNKNDEFQISWEKIKLFYTSNHCKIQLNEDEYFSPFNIIDRDSIIYLTKKYCPPNHELYKYVEKYAKENKLPFA